MKEPRALTMGERWRLITSQSVEDHRLEQALASLPSIRSPRVRVGAGSIQAEIEGSMGALHEVSIQAPPLPAKIWPQVVRVLRRSSSMLEALKKGQVPRSFDRLIARIVGEAVFPEVRRVSSACTCSEPDPPCRHILALHELFARRLEDSPWELLVLRGVPLRDLIDQASRSPAEGELPPLAFGAKEEPVLFPEGAGVELDTPFEKPHVRSLLGAGQAGKVSTVRAVIEAYAMPATPAGEDSDAADATARDGSTVDSTAESPKSEAGRLLSDRPVVDDGADLDDSASDEPLAGS